MKEKLAAFTGLTSNLGNISQFLGVFGEKPIENAFITFKLNQVEEMLYQHLVANKNIPNTPHEVKIDYIPNSSDSIKLDSIQVTTRDIHTKTEKISDFSLDQVEGLLYKDMLKAGEISPQKYHISVSLETNESDLHVSAFLVKSSAKPKF